MTFRNLEWEYPNSDELDGFLDELALRYNMDIVFDKHKHPSKIAETISEEKELLSKADTNETNSLDHIPQGPCNRTIFKWI